MTTLHVICGQQSDNFHDVDFFNLSKFWTNSQNLGQSGQNFGQIVKI